MNGPYMSAVSSSVEPRSSARCTALSDSSPRCREVLYAQLIGMHPSPTAPTESAAAPIVLRSTCSLPSLSSHPNLTSAPRAH
ncbi:hypothetical protein GCM10010389_14150 [Streptomyces echinoruber]|uniref:Uncharacterized protein n=1 Tax=Streptomyces echinoruber TaxID=68898 RepID=A0A918R1P3_9ACTN|nr:hypothetical protein GCM10010389_14150 [Streptomyces echinoruber]